LDVESSGSINIKKFVHAFTFEHWSSVDISAIQRL